MDVIISIVGGFLGAGKTSLIASQAKLLETQGERVAVITNDQGKDLIDTRSMSAKNITAIEITGGCFCCRFDELDQTIHQVISDHQPTWIFAEAVGSCTDLVATVLRPLRNRYGSKFRLTPITIVVDWARAQSILHAKGSGFTDDVGYLYLQQIKEADIVLINKMDMTNDDISDVQSKLELINPKALFVHTSAVDGTGLVEWVQHLSTNTTAVGLSSLHDLDYDRYTAAEAELGWVNMSLEFTSDGFYLLDDFVMEIGENIHHRLREQHFEAAHLKLMGLSAAGHINGSVTTTSGPWQWNSRVHTGVKRSAVIVNARVCADPDVLSAIILQSIEEACQNRSVVSVLTSHQAFRPSPPTPVHRIT